MTGAPGMLQPWESQRLDTTEQHHEPGFPTELIAGDDSSDGCCLAPKASPAALWKPCRRPGLGLPAWVRIWQTPRPLHLACPCSSTCLPALIIGTAVWRRGQNCRLSQSVFKLQEAW